MKYNYPIKYAAMPIIEPINRLEKATVCYIVSKCYLVGEKTIYKIDGDYEKEYAVVFPYQPIYFDDKTKIFDLEKVIPQYNFNFQCNNYNLVEQVFDNYEEALKFTNEKNSNLINNECSYIPRSKAHKEREEFQNNLRKYRILTNQILDNTITLDQSYLKKLDKVIRVNPERTQISRDNLYQYLEYNMQYNLDKTYKVYSLSLEQYQYLLELIAKQNYKDIIEIEKKAKPLIYHEADAKNVMIMNINGEVLYYLNEKQILENADKECPLPTNSLNEIVYTTETLKDLILSFEKTENFELKEMQGHVLTKTL